MADEQPTEHKAGAPWSGQNKIPTVGQFIQRLDKDKKQRDQDLDAQTKQQKLGGSDVTPHKNEKKEPSGAQKTVTDPVTGKQVTIEDVNEKFMDRVKDPQLSVPNANLGKETTVKTDASQSNPEYGKNQDITAPPDPVAEGSTSDVPIHGEKTNILFHPTPSVSYEPMFVMLETRAGGLCIGLLVAVTVLGRMFGGSLLGLIPLSLCIASGVWLWMKEVVRSGREVEWQSEQTRGETVRHL